MDNENIDKEKLKELEKLFESTANINSELKSNMRLIWCTIVMVAFSCLLTGFCFGYAAHMFVAK